MYLNNLRLNKIWTSPTIMTWLSYATKAISLVVVIPLILNRFNPAEISLWYLFSSIFVLLSLADMGFRQTFVRIISYAYGGVKDFSAIGTTKEDSDNLDEIPINWALLEDIFSAMKTIYKYLAVLLLVLLLSIGTYLLIKPISLVENHKGAWISWG
ncbi:Uncharacterised protein [Sphingobacterium multivorum]|uniref:Uncharacterized protein n=2 Tax=Sphingobacterium multivorum TaxID=28454 RepID=A0A2X2J497_SPHMU|nr:hypothetical protein [Sphingobacterium multivorum]SPZ88464.1 Uncharacterised protein [Sphingobacterium multivorum]